MACSGPELGDLTETEGWEAGTAEVHALERKRLRDDAQAAEVNAPVVWMNERQISQDDTRRPRSG